MTKRKTLAKLADLAGKAGRWLGLAPPTRHNPAFRSCVVGLDAGSLG